VQANQQGYVVVKLPLPPERYLIYGKTTLALKLLSRTVSWLLFSGDGGYKDEDYILLLEESMMLSMWQDIVFQRLRWKK
jgi:propionyl-CoA synthetase